MYDYRWEYEEQGTLLFMKLLRGSENVAHFQAPRERDWTGYLNSEKVILAFQWCKISFAHLYEQVASAPGLTDMDRVLFLGIRGLLEHVFSSRTSEMHPLDEKEWYAHVSVAPGIREKITAGARNSARVEIAM